MELTMERLRTDASEDLSAWVAVEVTAGVNNLCIEPRVQVVSDVPLDVMILVDTS
jgi:hypothetical protein